MHLSDSQRRRQVPPFFTDHTPRHFETSGLVSPRQSPEIFGFSGHDSNDTPAISPSSIMRRPTPDRATREQHYQASSLVLRKDLLQTEEDLSGDGMLSRADSWSLHCSYSNQRPYKTSVNEKINAADSVLERMETRRLVDFLRDTGPTAPHRKPSKVERRVKHHGAKKALRFLRIGHKQRAPGPDDMEFEDEGGLLRIPQGVEQRQTSSGKRHLALMLNPDKHRCYGRPSLDANVDGTFPKSGDKPPMLPSPDVMDSHVSIAFSEGSQYGDVLNSWIASASGEQSRHNTPATLRKPSAHTVRTDTTVRVVEHDLSPIRPAASEPPSPMPDSAVSKPDSHIIECFNRPVKRPFEACRVLSSHPPQKDETLTALPKIALPNEEFPTKHPSPGKEVEIKHPSPTRFASYPVLLQRASSMASSLYPRSISDSPGPPPPRSPLRLRRDPRTIESIIATHNISQTRKATPKLLAQIEPVPEYNEVLEAMKPTVVTDCTGPIKRPRSRNRDSTGRATNQVLCTDRVQRSRARKLRQHPYPILAVDKAADEAADTGPRRLRKARPQLQIPLKPAPLVTRTSSSASSTASWKKSTQSARTPVSPVLSQDSPRSQDTRTGYTPMSPTTSNVSDTMCIALSPVMLVAEETPVPKTKSTPKLAKVVVKEGKSYVPRPRSASIPRNAMKRRNRAGAEAPPARTPSRPATPATGRQKDDMPPLPSPPPNRALPPTPPASGSEKPGRRTGDKNGLPVPPAYEIAPKQNKHVACQARRKSNSPKDIPSRTAGLEARLDVLERHNCLLEAALTAVLKVNGKLNGPPRQSQVLELETILSMVWENRVARRSAASQRSVSHAPSGSYESALDMYFATRLGAGAACSA